MSNIKYYNRSFNDKRLGERANSLQEAMNTRETCVVQRLSTARSEQNAYYRFLNNERVRESELIENMATRCNEQVIGRHVLSIQDTTEVNLTSHRSRLKQGSGIGPLGNSECIGFFMHPSLVIDADMYHLLGFADVKIWNRPENNPDKFERNYQQLPIEEKESYKWIESARASKQALQSAELITVVEDREGDIYDQFVSIPDERTHLLVRSCQNRRTSSNVRLHEFIHSKNCTSKYELQIAGDIRNNRKGRVAEIEVRYGQAQVKKPQGSTNPHAPNELELHMVEACEANPPKGEKPVIWRLITTHHIENHKQACQIVEWYKQRWQIEQVFRLLKQKGMGIETSEMEQGWAIRKLTIMLLDTVLKIMQMHHSFHKEEDEMHQPAGAAFSKAEIECLKHINPKLEGYTEKQKNHDPPESMAWASWIIARLGSWHGYKSQKPPGVYTFKRGLERFLTMFEGWSLIPKHNN